MLNLNQNYIILLKQMHLRYIHECVFYSSKKFISTENRKLEHIKDLKFLDGCKSF